MKAIFVILAISLIGSAHASNYYFSSVLGNDSRTSTEAQDPFTPWKTLDKLNSFFINLKPGDSIFLKRNETFYGSIIPKKSGSLNFPIVISAYGTGDKPAITSFVTLTNWVSKGKGIWESFDSTLGAATNVVLLNGVEQEMGRYPNSNAANKGYLNFESHNGKTSITDDDLNTSVNWKGAEMVLRPRHWILERCLITAQSGHTISYTTSSPYEPYENYGYFIQNSIKTLDKPGEWYYDPAAKKLSVYFGSGGPSAYVVQAATTESDLISCSSRSNIVFDNLAIKGSNNSGFFINNGSNIYIQNCDILFSGITAVIVRNHKNLHIENCTIANSNNNAIELEYGVVNAVVKNNKIVNTAVRAGMLQNGEGTGVAIAFNGNGAAIEGNEIRKTGFIGISFYGSNISLKNNFIDTFCFVKDDGGGIYSHGELFEPVNRKITDNIIINGIGAGPGTDHFDKRSVTGIYMDANIKNVEITGNTITTCNQGIFIQSSAGMIIKNNTVFNNVRQLTMIRDKDNNPVRNSIITQNIFFAKSLDQWSLYVMSSEDDIKLFGRLDSNYYAKPLDDRLTIFTNYVAKNGAGITQNLDLAGWRELYGQDKHSKKSARQIMPYRLTALQGSNKFLYGGDFNTNTKGVNASSTSTVTWNNSAGLDEGCVEVSPSSRGSSVYMKVDSVTAGKNYLLSYSLIGSADNNMSIGASLRQSGPPFATLTPILSRKIDVVRTDNEMMFSPLISEASVNLTFKVDDQSKYFLDNIKFYEASAQMTNPDDSIRFEYNASGFNKSVALKGTYIDVASKVYLNHIVLKPFTSAVLIKASNKTKNFAPKVSITTPANDTAFAEFSSVFINAVATDVDGTIEKVEFYNDSTLLKTIFDGDYSFTMDSVVFGNYSITARATDNNGLVTVSSPVNFSVDKANIAPGVKITSPFSKAIFSTSATIFIKAEATDVDGKIEKVEFYKDSTLLKTEYKPAYDCTLKDLAPGNYTITAKATDDKGLTAISAPVVFSVVLPNVAPSISIITPADSAVFSPFSNVIIKTAAADSDGSIAKVEFYSDSTLLKTVYTAPYNFTLQKLAPGPYSIWAKATDDSGAVTLSSAVSFSISTVNIAPTVVITSPLDNSVFGINSSVSISAVAADTDGTITKVQFYNDAILLKTEFQAPYDCTMDNLAAGKYTITAKATDNFGEVTVSSPVVFTVGALRVAPVISITTPVDNATYLSGANVYLNAMASDADGSISKVEFFDDSTLLFTATDSPYTFKWEHVRLGNYTLTAKATDNSGLVSTSASVTISVVPNKLPTVSIVKPADNQIFTEGEVINLKALAEDSDGRVTRVEFYNGITLLGAKYSSPYTFSWKNAPLGNAAITAKALDNWGDVSISSPINIAVIAQVQVPQASRSSSIASENEANNSSAVSPTNVALSNVQGSNNVSNTQDGRVLSQLNVYKLTGFRLSPNPAVNIMQVYFDGRQIYQKATLVIQNTSGMTVKKYPVTISGNKIEVEVSSLPPGMYIIGLSGDNFAINKKFLKLN